MNEDYGLIASHSERWATIRRLANIDTPRIEVGEACPQHRISQSRVASERGTMVQVLICRVGSEKGSPDHVRFRLVPVHRSSPHHGTIDNSEPPRLKAVLRSSIYIVHQ